MRRWLPTMLCLGTTLFVAVVVRLDGHSLLFTVVFAGLYMLIGFGMNVMLGRRLRRRSR